MEQPPKTLAVVLHGLYAHGQAPFGLLEAVENFLAQSGLETLRFPWPDSFTPLVVAKTLMDSRRSLFRALADDLDLFLREHIGNESEERDWIVVAHSAGGGVWYQWATHHAGTFVKDFQRPPRIVFTFAAPYQWHEGQRFKVAKNALLKVLGEPNLNPEDIVNALPDSLIVLIAEDDDTLLPTNTDFPSYFQLNELIVQYLVEGATHESICFDQLTLDIIDYHLRDIMLI
jgi:hypothetical protein